MPRKYRVKDYVENGYYHVYNRGVDKREIFVDDQDYRVFLHLLKYYLSPSKKDSNHPSVDLEGYQLIRPRPLANLSEEVDLLAYCLMPNHYHLLLKQVTEDGMPKLVKRLATAYSMYFNKRNQRVGHLFQGSYQAILVDKDPYLLHLSRYIHRNPVKLTRTDLVNYPYSSYPYYLKVKSAPWIKPDFVLKFFDQSNLLPSLLKYPSYKRFVESSNDDCKEILGVLTIDKQ